MRYLCSYYEEALKKDRKLRLSPESGPGDVSVSEIIRFWSDRDSSTFGAGLSNEDKSAILSLKACMLSSTIAPSGASIKSSMVWIGEED